MTVNSKTPIDDLSRAKINGFKVGLDDLINAVEAYRGRKYNEDIEYLDKKLGGIPGLCESLKTSEQEGLTPTDFEAREQQFGSNKKPPVKRTPFCSFFFGALDDFMLKLLLVCACVSIAIEVGFADPHDRSHAWIEGTAIFIAVFVVAFVGSWNDYQKEIQFIKLQAISDKDNIVVCLRQGKEELIQYDNIQVGDIIKIKAGMNVPVDGVIIHASGVQANESAMTGESDELKKESLENCKLRQEEKDAEYEYHKDPKRNSHDLPSPILLSGTQVATGEGWFLVVVIGKNSCVGKIMDKLEQRIETTPLQEKLEAIGTDVGKLGMYCALLTIHVLFLRFFISKFIDRSFDFFGGENTKNKYGRTDGSLKEYSEEWLGYLIIGVAVVVVAVPEGLPLAVMISLAYSVKKMLIDQNFVKRLASCEIMGGANNICSDKTGTLTMNKMTVTNIWAGRDQGLKVNDEKYQWRDYFNNDKHTQLIEEAICCNTSGSLREASATEQAMLNMVIKFGVDIEKKRSEKLSKDFTRFHFTSKRKRMSTIVQNCGQTEHGYDRRIHIKGAAEIVLGACTFYLNQDGEKIPLHDEMKSNLLQIITQYASQALRTICCGFKDLKPGDGGPTHEDMDEDGVIHAIEKKDFTLIGIFGIKDIIRKEVPDAVAKCQKAGITVRMVTGDNKITAMAIAKECRIIDEKFGITNDSVMEGPEFYERMGGLICKTCKKDSPCNCNPKDVVEGVKNISAFKGIWKNLRVLARSRPEDKYLLVTGLKEMGDVVAVTGDGTNDAPALKKADVGFAMGITGTDVAKHAADIIVMDDNFASIVSAAKWGRNIYDNIRKFLQFQITVNIVALFTAFVGSVILKESPLQPVQLLWVNLIMDSLGSLALATEPPKDALLDRPPYRRDEYIISRKMVKHLIGMSLWEITIVYAIVFAGEFFFPEPAMYWRFDRPDIPYLYPGRLDDWDGTPLWRVYEEKLGASRHMSNVFNCFVVMQIFNMINVRKIHDEINIFDGIFENSTYLIIWVIVAGGQALIMEFGERALKVNKGGLHYSHWIISICLGFTTWGIRYILTFIPDTWCPQFGQKQKNPFEDDDKSVLSLRRKRTQSFSLRQPNSQVNKENSGRQGSLR